MAKTLKSKDALKEETRRLLEEEQKMYKKAAEKSAAIKEKDLPGYDPNKDDEELVFYSEDDKEEENEYPTFGINFLDTLAETEAKKNKEEDLLGAKDYEKFLERENQKKEEIRKSKEKDLPGYRPWEKKYEFRDYYDQKQIFSDSIYDEYLTAEEYAMSEGKNAFENTVKGMFNNTRSTLAETVERGAFLLSDNIPGYKAAENVYLNNNSKEITDVANNHFLLAKKETSETGNKLINLADILSKEMGYNIFGLKAGAWLQIIDCGLKEYEKLRKSGVPKEEALQQSTKKAVFSFIEDKISDIGIKWLNKQLPKGNVYGITADTDDFVDNFESNNYNRANEKGELVNEFYDLLTDSEWADYYQKITERGKLNSTIGDVYVWNGNGIIVISKRVRITGNTNDYQVIGYEFAENSYEVAQAVQKEINKSGGKYDARRIEEIIGSFSE